MDLFHDLSLKDGMVQFMIGRFSVAVSYDFLTFGGALGLSYDHELRDLSFSTRIGPFRVRFALDVGSAVPPPV